MQLSAIIALLRNENKRSTDKFSVLLLTYLFRILAKNLPRSGTQHLFLALFGRKNLRLDGGAEYLHSCFIEIFRKIAAQWFTRGSEMC